MPHFIGTDIEAELRLLLWDHSYEEADVGFERRHGPSLSWYVALCTLSLSHTSSWTFWWLDTDFPLGTVSYSELCCFHSGGPSFVPTCGIRQTLSIHVLWPENNPSQKRN